MSFTDAFNRAGDIRAGSNPDLAAAGIRLREAGLPALIPAVVAEAADDLAHRPLAAAAVNSLLAAYELGLRCQSGPGEVLVGDVAAMLSLFDACLNAGGRWIAAVIELPARGRLDLLDSDRLNARLKLLNATSAKLVADHGPWIGQVRRTARAAFERQVATVTFEDRALVVNVAAAQARRAGLEDAGMKPSQSWQPAAQLALDWTQTSAAVLGATLDCGAVRIASPRNRAGSGFDWD